MFNLDALMKIMSASVCPLFLMFLGLPLQKKPGKPLMVSFCPAFMHYLSKPTQQLTR